MRKEISDRLRYIRKKWGRTQAHMAERLNVSQRSYAAYERAEADIPTYSLDYYAGMGWNMHWIFTGTGPERITDDEGRPLVSYVPIGSEPTSQDMRGEHLMIAHELADEALRGLWLPKPRYFDLVALAYDGLTKGLPYAKILDFARSAASNMTQEQGDDGGQGVASARQKRAG